MPLSASPFSCVLIGSESLLIQCGETLLDAGHQIRAVASRDAQILDWAARKQLDCVPTGKSMAAALHGLEFDYLFSITNLSIIPDAVLELPRRAAINFHDGPLPRYAGMYAPAWALLNGESEYGVSFHAMTGGVDEGDLYVQRFFPIGPDETSLTLNTRCFAAAIEAFGELVTRLADGSASPTAQDLSQRSYFGRHERPEATGVCDWTKPAAEVARSIRALDFGGYENAFAAAKVMHNGRVCIVASAQPGESSGGADPGRLIEVGDENWQVACGDGVTLRLSGFSCPFGRALTSQEAAARLGIHAGEKLIGPDAAARARIDDLCRENTPSEAFWTKRLERFESPEIPYLRTDRIEDGAARFESIDLSVPSRLREATADRSTNLIAGFVSYLGRVNGRSRFDLTFSQEAFGQRLKGLGELYSKEAPLAIDFDPSARVEEVVEHVGRAVSKLGERGGFLTDLIHRTPRLRDNPILAAGHLGSVAIAITSDPERYCPRAGTDFAFVLDPSGDRVRLVHDARALTQASAARIAHQLSLLLEGMADSDRPVAKLPMLDADERRRVLVEWNDTAVAYDRDQTIHGLFEAQAGRTPNAAAVAFEGDALTYFELDVRANQLAHHLASLGIGPDKLVGVHVERSIDMVVSILAVLKSGGAYVPLDPTYPADRIAYMIEDSKASVVISQDRLRGELPAGEAMVVAIDRDRKEIEARSTNAPSVDVAAHHLAYVIYTSGSTGNPKGVMVEHRNAVNFFVGMDERISHETPGTWLAVTSLSFDISVLELLWTLTRGFKVVVFADRDRHLEPDHLPKGPWRPMDFGLALWGSDAGPGAKKYELMLESAKFADTHGFSSVHTPERHFGAFGGPFPNPSVTSAAIAAVTEHVQIRASSCVLPLHHPVRVAEEFAVVDNLSNGRVGIAFASGWQPNDFVIRPDAFATAKTGMLEGVETVKRLWRGEAVEFENPQGKMVATQTLPRPVQPELNAWMTTAGNVETFRAAGAGGFHVLTHLLGQTLEELAEKIKVYRRARASAGLDPATGIVTCMLHTFVGDDNDRVREIVRAPMKDYLASAMKLVVGFAWSFPAFERPGGPNSKPEDVDLSTLTEEENDAILEFAFERYYETSGLFGTPEICADMVDRVKLADVNEIACLIDFGVDTQIVLGALEMLDQVRVVANTAPVVTQSNEDGGPDHSFAAQVERHGVTHMQCTPSHATMLLNDLSAREAFAGIPELMIGGEAFPISLAHELDAACKGRVTNMYGPTETTIWSSTQPVAGRPDVISIGRPIANTQFFILGNGDEPLPVGVSGELLIGGDGVVRGYHERPDLTAERFIPNPFASDPASRLYRTGDLARWSADGTIDFQGRMDHQVKIRGYRIELGEIEVKLASHDGVREAVVIAREDVPGDVRLVAYLIAEGAAVADDDLRTLLRQTLPEFMVPATFVSLERFPMTPNGKIDRKALPAPDAVRSRSKAEFLAPANELEQTIAGVWKDVLYLEQVGVNDNFFDLGGHSLLVVQAHRKLREVCPVPLSLTDLYRFPTIAGLANHLSSDGSDDEQAKQSQARGEKRRQALGRRRRR